MRTTTTLSVSLLLALLGASACGADGPSADDLNQNPPSSAGQMNGAGGGASSGSSSVSGSGSVDGTSGSSVGTAGSSGSGAIPVGGSGSGGSGSATAGSAGAGTTGGAATGGGTGTGGGGGSGGGATGPYAPRSGTFKMMVYSRQGPGGYRHAAAIGTGKTMLAEIGLAQGFDIVQVETDADNTKYITPEGLAQFEIIFFLNSTSDIFNDAQQKTYEDWMTQKNGAFAGVHAATDTENGWAFYSEVTGQYYNGHGNAGTADQIQLESTMLEFPALKGVPNPWQRNEEWYKFNSWQQWSAKPGFKILGKKAADGQPIMWTREYGNFRSFYTAIGHDGVVFQDATVKKHITGGIMWAVRREHLIK
ncbi:MAG: Crp/FNR family transcriptional regulator [Polyangiaceae bacterium]|jgi:type 1 glutamine amidotransferase|nr:Crp/FNR family transcriptional regulator [Polyangiaceae bacterium]